MSCIEGEFSNGDVAIHGRVIMISLNYPRSEGHANTVDIDLCDVRASDGIRVTYDFDRDGWVILQPKGENLEEWVETAFVRSWALEEKAE